MILEKKIDQILMHTKLPLETRRPWDTDPMVKFGKDRFEEVLMVFLEQSENEIEGTNYDAINKDGEIKFVRFSWAHHRWLGEDWRSAI